MRSLNNTFRATGAIVMASALLLSGCSSSNDKKTDEGSATTASKSAEAGKESTTASATADAKKDGAFTVTDVAGRTVTLNKAPERVIFGESRAAMVTAFLNKEHPTNKIVAWGGDLQSAVPDFYSKLLKVDPKAADIPVIGRFKKNDITVESLLAYKPDILVFTLQAKKAAEQNGMLKKMDDAGLKYVFTDFRDQPLKNTVPSVEVIGKVIGREKEANDFATFYTKKLNDISTKAAQSKTHPKAFLWRAGGLIDCCGTFGTANLGGVLTAAGADNIAVNLLDGKAEGDVTIEKVLSEQPKDVIVTGGDWNKWASEHAEEGPVQFTYMGYGATPEKTNETFNKLLAQTPGMEQTDAVKDGNIYGLYHQFYNSPFNIFALEAMAKWVLPEQFKDLDASADFKKFHDEHMPFAADGTFFIKLK